MKAAIDFAYANSPLVLQNLMISTYGRYLRQLRYGDQHEQHLKLLSRSEQFSPDEIDEYRRERLTALLRHAYEHVPFYRTLFNERGLKPSGIDPANIAETIPIVTKSTLREQNHAFRSRSSTHRRFVEINTSGTSGTPLTISATRSAIQHNYAFFARFLRWCGVALGAPSATFAGRMFIPQAQKKPPFWRRNAATNTTLFSSYHISSATIPYYVTALEELSPTFIDAYPSAIHAIARFLVDSRMPHAIRPKVIITSSETLGDEQRRIIEEAFCCPVRDQYGSAEMVAFISQCERGSYHVNPEYGLVEILRADGYPARPGEPGDMICTGFLNHAMPLIRYRIGDTAMMASGRCDCGRNFPVVQSILGRSDDLIVTRDGRFVGRLDPVFKGLRAIKETQIVQTDVDRIVVRLVRADTYTNSVGEKLLAELARRVGEGIDIRIEEVSEIAKTANGKFQSVISLVHKDGRPLKQVP